MSTIETPIQYVTAWDTRKLYEMAEALISPDSPSDTTVAHAQAIFDTAGGRSRGYLESPDSMAMFLRKLGQEMIGANSDTYTEPQHNARNLLVDIFQNDPPPAGQ